MEKRHCAVAAFVAVCVLASCPARAQTLVDAANRAEAQRRALGPSTAVYTDASLAGGSSGYEALLGDNYLLADHFNAYAGARDGIAQVRMGRIDIDEPLYDRERKAKDRYDLERAYGESSSVMWVLSNHKLDPRGYFKTDAAFARALRDAQLSKEDRKNLPRARRLNAEYVDEHNLKNWAKGLWTEQQLESQRSVRHPQ